MDSITVLHPLISDLFFFAAEGSLNLALAGLLFSLLALGLALPLRRSHPALQNAALMASLAGLLLMPLVLPVLDGLDIALARIDFPVADKTEGASAFSSASASAMAAAAAADDRDHMAIPLVASSGFAAMQRSAERQGALPRLLPKPMHVAIAAVLIWLAGSFVILARWIVGAAKLRQFESRLSEIKDGAVAATWRSIAADKHANVALLQGPENMSPMTFGVFSPCVVVPADLADHLSTEEIRAVLAHELAHIQNRDALLGMIQRWAAAIYWWNPIVHWLLRRHSLLREMLSDGAASSHLHPAAYAASLLRLAETTIRATPATGQAHGVLLNRSKHPLEQRFKMLTRYYSQTNNQSVTMRQTIAIYSSIIAATFFCSAVHTSFAQDDNLAEIDNVEPPEAADNVLPEVAGLRSPEATDDIHFPDKDEAVQRDNVVADLQQQIRELQTQIEQLARQSRATELRSEPETANAPWSRSTSGSSHRRIRTKRHQSRAMTAHSSLSASPDALPTPASVLTPVPIPSPVPVSSPASPAPPTPPIDPGFLIESPDDGSRIEMDSNGILTIAGPKGETLRVDTNSGIAKAFSGFLEKVFETATKEMERELETTSPTPTKRAAAP